MDPYTVVGVGRIRVFPLIPSKRPIIQVLLI